MKQDGRVAYATGWKEGRELSTACLSDLQSALAKRGMRSDLDTRSVWPRLRVHGDYEDCPAVSDFENSVVAIPLGDGWWFTWPWAEKICEVTDITSAADRITLELGENTTGDES